MSKGFTLIELIVVIVLLGILSAMALPKYLDLGTEAKRAANQEIFRVFAEQTIKAHTLFEIRKNQGQDLDFNGSGENDLRFVYGYPVGGKTSEDTEIDEILQSESYTPDAGIPCIRIFEAIMEEGLKLQSAPMDNLNYGSCLEEADICVTASRNDAQKVFECRFVFTNTYLEADEDMSGNSTMEGFNYVVQDGVSAYAYVKGTMAELDTRSGSAFFSESAGFKSLIRLGDYEKLRGV